jgi:quinol monooxygenase YgiN
MVNAKWLGGLALSVLGVVVAGCGDDEAGSGGATGTTTSSSSSGSGSGTTTGATTSSGEGGAGGDASGGGDPGLYLAMVRGELFTADMEEAQASHDAIAAGGEAQAKAAGDVAHDVHLGTDLLGGTPNEFLGMDRWTDAAAMGTFYSDPAIQQAFGSLFAAPPSIEAFAHQASWHSWGDLDVSDGVEPHYWAVVRGRLASSDLAAMQALHDQIAGGGQGAAEALGDLGHVVFLSLEDEQEFLAIDVWDNADGPVMLYTDPSFGAAFAQLFESPPSLRIYASTDWYQW